MDRKERRSALIALPADEFEWLVHALVEEDAQASGLIARKLRAPDRGADSLLLAKDGSVVSAVQVKHHRPRIHWESCVDSLLTAAAAWDPDEFLFAFSCDFTAPQQKAFAKKLAGRLPDKTVRAWTLTDLEQRLDAHPRIATSFLGASALSIADVVDRAARFGGLRLNSVDDLVDRARELAEHGSQLDPHYNYAAYAGPLTSSPPQWPDGSVATLVSEEGGMHVEVVGLPRPGHDPGEPTISFTEDNAGREAMEQVRAALGAGLSITLAEGVELTHSLEPKLKGLTERPVRWKVHMAPSKPSTMRLSVTAGTDAFEREFQLYQIPPREGYLYAFQGSTRGLRLEYNLLSDIATTGQIWVELWTEYGHDAARNLETSECLRMWVSRTKVKFSGDLAAGIEEEEISGGPFFTDDEFAELASKMDLFQLTIQLEEYFGRRLNFPPNPTVREVAQLQCASHVLQEHSGTMTYEPEPIVVLGNQLPELIDEVGWQRRETVLIAAEVFGDRLEFGEAEYLRPPLRIVEIAPIGDGPSCPASVSFEVAGDPVVVWNLTSPPPRLAGAQ